MSQWWVVTQIKKVHISALSVSILGLIDGPILSSRFADSGDELWIIANKDGYFLKIIPLGCGYESLCNFT